jgi:hypothetical protein
MTIEAFNKDPSAKIDTGWDWSAWLGTDTITASSWTVPTGLTSVDESNTTTTTTIWLTGGTHGQDYSLVNQITTAGGRIDQRTIKVQVRER